MDFSLSFFLPSTLSSFMTPAPFFFLPGARGTAISGTALAWLLAVAEWGAGGRCGAGADAKGFWGGGDDDAAVPGCARAVLGKGGLGEGWGFEEVGDSEG